MGLVREPKGIDFIVGHSMLTEKERLMISEIIAQYKRTGKVPSNFQRPKPRSYKNTRVKKKIAGKRD